MRGTTLCTAFAALLSLFATVPPAFAQSYPVKPVRPVVPFPPGGLNDVVSRLVSQKVGEFLGQGMVIENRGGAGGSQHVGGELLKALTGVQMTHVPYSGGGPAMVGLLSGQTQIMIEPLPSALPQLKSGKVKALAVTLLTRLATLPELPTVAESGVPRYDMPTWLAWFAPATTPRDVMVKLNTELGRALRSPDLRQQMLQRGTDPIVDSLEEANDYVRAEMARWTAVVRDSGMKVE